MESIENKKIILKIIQEESRYFCFEVANKSRIYHNNEIEKFVKYGYSTKGENRGVGLVRVRDIAKKYKAVFEIGNYVYNNENYLRFRIKFERQEGTREPLPIFLMYIQVHQKEISYFRTIQNPNKMLP